MAGLFICNGGAYTYQYNLPDHLGNNRISFYSNSGTASLLQEDEYYSFGLRKSLYDNSNNNRYLYNGKEVQTDLKDQYDYGARFYDPVIGRFGTIDKLATQYPWYSQYQFAGNEVPNAVDRDGLEPAYLKPDGTYSLARDGQLQRPLTGENLNREMSDLHSRINSSKNHWGEELKGLGENLSNGGFLVQVLGYVGAVFTDGGTLPLVPVGEGMETTGTGLSVVGNVTQGKYKDAVVATGTTIIFGAGGKKLENLEQAGKLTTVQKTLLGAQLTGASKLVDKALDNQKDNDGTQTDSNSKIGDLPIPPPIDPIMQRDNILHDDLFN